MTIVDSLKAKGSTGGNNIAEAIKNLPMGGSDTYVLNIYEVYTEGESTAIFAIKPESILEINAKSPSRVSCLTFYGETLDDMGDEPSNMGTYVYGGALNYVRYIGVFADGSSYGINVGLQFSVFQATSIEECPEFITYDGNQFTLENTTFGKYMYVFEGELD